MTAVPPYHSKHTHPTYTHLTPHTPPHTHTSHTSPHTHLKHTHTPHTHTSHTSPIHTPHIHPAPHTHTPHKHLTHLPHTYSSHTHPTSHTPHIPTPHTVLVLVSLLFGGCGEEASARRRESSQETVCIAPHRHDNVVPIAPPCVDYTAALHHVQQCTHILVGL